MVENSRRGGYSQYASDLSAALTAQGGNVLYLASEDYECPAEISYNVKCLLRPLSPTMELHRKSQKSEFALIKTLSSLINFQRIRRYADEFDADIIHFHRTVPLTYAHFVPILRRRRPIVLTVHDVLPHRGTKILSNSWHLRKLYGSFNRLFVHSRANRDEILRKFACPAESIVVIPHGSDPNAETVPKLVARRRLELPQAGRIVLFLGVIRSNKRVDLLIKACSKAFASEDNKHLVIAGMPQDVSKDQVVKLLLENSIFDRATLHLSWLSDEVLDLHLDASDVCVFPYDQFYAQSGILMRAFAHGTPAIVTSGGSLAEAVTQGNAGFVVPPNDADSLANKIGEIFASKTLRARYSSNARKASKYLYNWRTVSSRTMQIYRELLVAS